MLFYILRHGDPCYDPDSLTERGKIQAKALAKRLASHGIDEIYSSPMIRAQETAAPTAILTNLKPVIENWTAESEAWKDFTVTNDDGSKKWIFQSYLKPQLCSREILSLGLQWYNHPLFKENNFESGYKRILNASDEFLARQGYIHDRDNCYYIEKEQNNKRIALFCHQGFGLSLLGTLLDIPLPLIWSSFDISHSCMTCIEFKGDKNGICKPKVISFSNDSHLYREGLPTRFENGIYY